MAIELTLQPSNSLPRVIVLTLIGTGRTLSARVLAPENRTTMCYCIASTTDWSLRVKDRALWCRGTAIDLSEEDVAKIRKTFESHGLVIEADFPTAAPLGPELAKVVACAVPPHGKREASRPSAFALCADGRALEFESETLAYALTHRETY